MTKIVNLSLTDEGTQRLDELCAKNKITRSEFIESLCLGLTDTAIEKALEAGRQLRTEHMHRNRRARSQKRKAAYLLVEAMSPEKVKEILSAGPAKR